MCHSWGVVHHRRQIARGPCSPHPPRHSLGCSQAPRQVPGDRGQGRSCISGAGLLRRRLQFLQTSLALQPARSSEAPRLSAPLLGAQNLGSSHILTGSGVEERAGGTFASFFLTGCDPREGSGVLESWTATLYGSQARCPARSASTGGSPSVRPAYPPQAGMGKGILKHSYLYL